MTRDRIAGLVLAGGRALRMGGGDKPLLRVGERPMLAAVIDALGVRPLAISANGDPARFAGFGVPVLPDGGFEGEGPLAGVLAGLEWAAGLGMTALLTAPGDTPFLPSGLAALLDPPPRCIAAGGRLHPLIALWPVGCAPALRSLLAMPGPRSVVHFGERIGVQPVEYNVRGDDPFANVNTGDDLARARAKALRNLSRVRKGPSKG